MHGRSRKARDPGTPSVETGEPEPACSDELAAAVEALRSARHRAHQVISDHADAQRGFELATEWAGHVKAEVEQAADMRADAVDRIREEEEITLTALADRVGVTKQRVGKMVERAQRKRGGAKDA